MDCRNAGDPGEITVQALLQCLASRRRSLVSPCLSSHVDSWAPFQASVLVGDVEARPQQNFDESHPFDVKVTWLFTNRHAIIEIKSLRKSVRASRESTSYTDSMGPQPAQVNSPDYLYKYRFHVPQKINRGYLVVIDARRRGVTEARTTINKEDGMYYEHREIAYDPKYRRADGRT